MSSMTLKQWYTIILLGTVTTVSVAETCIPSPTFVSRSQASNTMLKLVGMTDKTHLYERECWWGTVAFTPFYAQSVKGRRITASLFGADALCNQCNCTTSSARCCENEGERSILVQGSAVINRNERAWLADYFYLPTDFQSQLTFNPTIKNMLLNIDLYVGLDEWMCGMYVRLYGPLNWTKWKLNFCETVCATGSNSYTSGYFAPTGITRSNLLEDFSAFASGQAPATSASVTSVSAQGTVVIPGATFNGLHFAQINSCDQTRTGFAGLWLELGWDVLSDEDYHVGAALLAGAPTGNKRHAHRLFDPVVGNGKHWEVGGAFSAHYIFWRGCNEDKHLGIWVDANITHMFNAHEERTFDLCGKVNSRYILAERMSSTVLYGLSADPLAGTTSGTAPFEQFAGAYTPVANLTTLNSKIKVGVIGDVSALINYTMCNWSFDLGYNYWGRSCEQIEPSPCTQGCNRATLCDAAQDQAWALKGDARTYGFAGATASGIAVNQPVPLSATQSDATIHSGTNATATISTNVINPALQNQGVDFAQFARAGQVGSKVRLVHTPPSEGISGTSNNNQIKTSLQPVFLDCSAIDLRGTRGQTHKIFAHINYNGEERGCWTPYIGIGGSTEFASHQNSTDVCATTYQCIVTRSCTTCTNNELSQWAVWIKGGVFFN